jgi:hypothetical protein
LLLGPTRLAHNRAFELPDRANIQTQFVTTTHNLSCLDLYLQVGPSERRRDVVLMLYDQIVNEPCFSQLRTVEQLGYVRGCLRAFLAAVRVECLLNIHYFLHSVVLPEFLGKIILVPQRWLVEGVRLVGCGLSGCARLVGVHEPTACRVAPLFALRMLCSAPAPRSDRMVGVIGLGLARGFPHIYDMHGRARAVRAS